MKLNELKQPLKEAIDWSPLVGHMGQSYIGDKPEGQDREGQMAKNIFARNFMQKAIGGLDAAINSGLVDPNAVGGGAQPQTTQPQTTQPQTTQPQTPAQIRQQKQAAAAKTAQAGMTPKAPVAPNAAPQSPEEIRQQKQAAAAKTAQAGMTAKPAAAPSVPKARGGKVAGELSATPNAIRKRNARSIAADRNRLIGDNGNANESIYYKLNAIFESIINVDEATMAQAIAPGGKVAGKPNSQQSAQPQASQKQSISDYIQNLFKEFMQGVPMSNPTTVSQLKALADQVQATYAKDKGKAALTKLADLGWAVSRSPEAMAKKGQEEKPEAGQQIQQTQQGQQTQQVNPVADKQSKIGVGQINKIIPSLRKRDLLSVKKNVDNEVTKRGGAKAPEAPTAAPTAKDNVIKMPKGRVRAAREGGVTPEEQAKFDEKVKQAMANQKG